MVPHKNGVSFYHSTDPPTLDTIPTGEGEFNFLVGLLLDQMKRKRNDILPEQKVNLEEILGFTCRDGNGFASNTSRSNFAFIAGSVVVLYDFRSGTQSHFMPPTRDPKPLSCVALCTHAGIIAAGETGRQSRVLVWSCITKDCISQLKGHQYGVASIALSHDGRHLISVGLARDGYICVWDRENNVLATKFRASSVNRPISSVVFSSDGKFLVTAGKNHFKFWKVRVPVGSRTGIRSVSVIKVREFGIGKMKKEMAFVAVSCPIDHSKDAQRIRFYAVTEKGTLCMVYPNSSAIKMVELEVEKCHALSASTSWVACACNNGLVKLFDASSLKHAGNLCYAEEKPSRKTDNAHWKPGVEVEIQSRPPLPDALACQFFYQEQLVVFYGDQSFHIWNIGDMPEATRRCLLTSHSGYIWNIINVPPEYKPDSSLSCVAKECSGGARFATCSADGHCRLWDLAVRSVLGNISALPNDHSSYGNTCFVRAGASLQGCVSKDIASPGLRSMVVSSDGKHVAAGYFHGNINIFYLNNSDCVCIQDAHDGEILSLSFTWESVNGAAALSEAHGGHNLLASAGIDRKIHLFDVDRNFCHLASIDCNTSAATVVKIMQNGHQMLSFGADRSLVLHSIDITDAECKISCLGRIETSGIISDMAVDHRINIAFTMCQDNKINVIDILSKRLLNSFQHDGGTVEPMKIALDQSCSYLACSCANKCIRIYECMTGDLVAQATGHAAPVTGMIFLLDSVHLVSVSADGCIFLWKLPPLLTSRMLQRIEKRAQIHLPPSTISQPSSGVTEYTQRDITDKVQVEMNGEIAGFEFSLSRLPKWAQDKFIGNAPHQDVVTPGRCDHDMRSPCKDGTEASSESISPANYRTHSRAAKNNQWQTIHTVCMDLADSPTTSGVHIMTRGKGEEEMEAGANGMDRHSPPNKCKMEFERTRSIEEELEAMEGAADNVLKSFQQQLVKGSCNNNTEAATIRVASIERKIQQIRGLLHSQ